MPTNTDLVKDLPADFEVFGQAVDTSLADLKGGTSGQILAKNSNTDMDFVWIANDQGDITAVTAGTGISGGGTSGAVTITNSMATEITASGDMIIGTGSGTFDNLPIGSTGQVLTADTTVSPYKVKWATPAGGGKVLQVVAATYSTTQTTTSGTYADSSLTATITPSSASSKVLVMVDTNGILGTGSTNARGGLRLLRGATVLSYISTGLAYFQGGGGSSNGGFGASIAYLDTPATTSATTYKTQVNNNGGAGTIYFQFDDGTNGTTSSIVLLEIGA